MDSPDTHEITRERRRRARSIDGLGALAFAAASVGGVLSWFMAATQPALDPHVPHTSWFSALAQSCTLLPAWAREALRGGGGFGSAPGFWLGYCAPLAISTGCGVVLVDRLARARRSLDDDDARRVLRWALALAFVAVPAFNVLTQDIWLSVAWGRMLGRGLNPFASAFPAALSADLPLEYDPMPMTYGPVWALACAFAVSLGAGTPLGTWLVLKLILCGAWCACLWSVSELARRFGPERRTLALALAGFSPIGWHCGVAEGHNDVLMVALLLLWLRSLRSRPFVSPIGPLFLAASVLAKYVTAPLVLVDALVALRAKPSFARYALRVAPALALLLAGAALVALSSRGIGVTSSMRDWKFLDPADVFRLLERSTGLPTASAGYALVAIAFVATALRELSGLAKAPAPDGAERAVLAVMTAVCMVVVGHVWPWFFVWCVPLAALAYDFWLSRFVLAAGLIAPFTIVHWWRFGAVGAVRSELPSLVMYTVALVASLLPKTAVLSTRWRRRSPAC